MGFFAVGVKRGRPSAFERGDQAGTAGRLGALKRQGFAVVNRGAGRGQDGKVTLAFGAMRHIALLRHGNTVNDIQRAGRSDFAAVAGAVTQTDGGRLTGVEHGVPLKSGERGYRVLNDWVGTAIGFSLLIANGLFSFFMPSIWRS